MLVAVLVLLVVIVLFVFWWCGVGYEGERGSLLFNADG